MSDPDFRLPHPELALIRLCLVANTLIYAFGIAIVAVFPPELRLNPTWEEVVFYVAASDYASALPYLCLIPAINFVILVWKTAMLRASERRQHDGH